MGDTGACLEAAFHTKHTVLLWVKDEWGAHLEAGVQPPSHAAQSLKETQNIEIIHSVIKRIEIVQI